METEIDGAAAEPVAGRPSRQAWIEVDLAALRRNARRLADAVAPARLLPMIKADGYGLGAVRVAGALRPVRPYGLGVATVGEGAALRDAGVEERIVVFSPCVALDLPALRRHRLEPAVLGIDALRRISADGAGGDPLPAHLEVDTGIGRAGLPGDEPESWVEEVARDVRAGRLRVESTYSHFHSAESDPAATREQLARLESALRALGDAGVDPGPRHIANTAAALGDPSYHLDLVRPGLYLYGGGRELARGSIPAPEAVVRVRARVLEARDVSPGTTVSYGAAWTADGPARLATLGIGYADGLPLGLSNRGSVILPGGRAPMRGVVCMDVTVVDVTEVGDVEAGAVATLLGREGGREIGLEELAAAGRTIEYVVLTGLGRRLPRVYADEGAGEEERATDRTNVDLERTGGTSERRA